MIRENTVFLGIGSNLNKKKNILSCIKFFESSFKYCLISPTYQSPSFGFIGHDFHNLVIKIKTHFELLPLKKWLMYIEDIHGRDRRQKRYSNRTLDIDILLFNTDVYQDGNITIPRPEILTQGYILKPLIDISIKMKHPKTQNTFEQHWDKLQNEHPSKLKLVNYKYHS